MGGSSGVPWGTPWGPNDKHPLETCSKISGFFSLALGCLGGFFGGFLGWVLWGPNDDKNLLGTYLGIFVIDPALADVPRALWGGPWGLS